MPSKNLAWFTVSNTPGTSGNLTVAAAVDALHVTLGSGDDGKSFSVRIFESGIGSEIRTACVYTHGTTTLTRGTLETSTTGSALNFTSGAQVQIVETAAEQERGRESAIGLWQNSHKAYGPMSNVAAGSTLAVTVDRAYALPCERAIDADIDAILFRVTTAGAAGKLARCAIFAVGSDGLPAAKLAESATVAVDTTGNKFATFTAFRPPKRFFVCFVSDGAPTVLAGAGGISQANSMGLGASFEVCAFIHHVGATSTTFPGTWTPVANASNAAAPQLFVRVP